MTWPLATVFYTPSELLLWSSVLHRSLLECGGCSLPENRMITCLLLHALTQSACQLYLHALRHWLHSSSMYVWGISFKMSKKKIKTNALSTSITRFSAWTDTWLQRKEHWTGSNTSLGCKEPRDWSRTPGFIHLGISLHTCIMGIMVSPPIHRVVGKIRWDEHS